MKPPNFELSKVPIWWAKLVKVWRFNTFFRFRKPFTRHWKPPILLQILWATSINLVK